jgi:hypothetical protein
VHKKLFQVCGGNVVRTCVNSIGFPDLNIVCPLTQNNDKNTDSATNRVFSILINTQYLGHLADNSRFYTFIFRAIPVRSTKSQGKTKPKSDIFVYEDDIHKIPDGFQNLR